MKCQSLFLGQIRKNIISLSSAESARRAVKVTVPYLACLLINYVYILFYFANAGRNKI